VVLVIKLSAFGLLEKYICPPLTFALIFLKEAFTTRHASTPGNNSTLRASPNPNRAVSPTRSSTVPSPQVSPIATKSPGKTGGTNITADKDDMDNELELSKQTIRQLEFWHKQSELDNQEINNRLNIKGQELEEVRGKFKQGIHCFV
jgi:hypothetical protein